MSKETSSSSTSTSGIDVVMRIGQSAYRYGLPGYEIDDLLMGIANALGLSRARHRDPLDARLHDRWPRRAAPPVHPAWGGLVQSAQSDPLDVSQYTVEEIEAAVEVAENWGTYVTVHSYSAKAIQNAIRGGVRNVEHGQMIDEETAKMMKETNTSIFLSHSITTRMRSRSLPTRFQNKSTNC